LGKRRADKGIVKPAEQDPDRLALLLLRYAYQYAASVGWKVQDRAIARGEGIEDLVQDALASLHGGDPKRRWDCQKHPDPMDHLRSFVNSRLSSLARCYDRKHVKYSVDPEQHAVTETPESLLMRDQEEAWRARLRDLVLTEILGDSVLVAVYDLLEKEEVASPAELAQRLNLSLEDAKNAKKRFRRVWERAIATLDAETPWPGESAHG